MGRGSARLCSRRQWSREGISRYLLCEPLWLKTKKSLTTEGTEGHRGKPAQLSGARHNPSVKGCLRIGACSFEGAGRIQRTPLQESGLRERTIRPIADVR